MEKNAFILEHSNLEQKLNPTNSSTDNHKDIQVSIKCPAPDIRNAPRWGDYHFALALKKSLKKFGYSVRLDLLDSWYSSLTQHDDVVITLRGKESYKPSPGRINIMWHISHPDMLEVDEINKYDHCFIASEYQAKQIALEASTPVTTLLQCSDPEVFHPNIVKEHKNNIIFVGNTRGESRTAVSVCLQNKISVKVYGMGWNKLIPHEYIEDSHIPNTELHKFYSSSNITLNDHWPDMARLGFVSNRIFDVALSEGFLISDSFRGADIFENKLVTFEKEEDLKKIIEFWTKNHNERKNKAKLLRDYVLKNHTFDMRARVISDTIEKIMLHKKTAPP